MVHALKVPDSLPSFRVEGEQAIGIQVVAHSVAPVEIEHGGTSRDIENPALRIERHASPIVGRPSRLPCALGPGFVTRFSRVWDEMERPELLHRADIENPNIRRGRGRKLRVVATN